MKQWSGPHSVSVSHLGSGRVSSLSVLTGRWGRKEQGEDKRPLRGKLLVGGCVFVYLSIGIMGCLVLLYLRTDSNPLHWLWRLCLLIQHASVLISTVLLQKKSNNDFNQNTTLTNDPAKVQGKRTVIKTKNNSNSWSSFLSNNFGKEKNTPSPF